MDKINLNQALEHEARNRLPGYEWDRIRQIILHRDGNTCVKCQDYATEVDHIVPVALGGTDDFTNLQSLCSECHKKKTVEDIEKVRRARRFKMYKNRIGGFD